MKRVMSKLKLILFFSYVVFIAHTLAASTESVENNFIAHHQQQREARLSTRARSNLQSNSASLNYTSNWAGAVQTLSNTSDTFNSVSAQWTLPVVSLPPSANGSNTWWSSEAVVIDGWSSCSTGGGVLAAGTDSYVEVSSSGDVTTGALAWYEWYPNNSASFPGFLVAPNDVVKFSVTATSKSEGTVVVNNLSTGNSTSVTLSSPSPSDNLCGMSAAWIVADPGSMLPFTVFANVSFQNCTATSTGGATFDLTGATLIDMTQNNQTIASAVVLSSTELQAYYG